MTLLSPEKISEIRERTDIVSLIGERVQLRRAGVNYLGLCPFHEEKSPSFNVNPSKQFFYCFGCQKSGDVFTFLVELEGRSFAEVAHDLAQRAGVEIPKDASERAGAAVSDEKRARLLRLHELAALWFTKQLALSSSAQAYVESRAIDTQVKTAFRIGYAPKEWDALLLYLKQRNVPLSLAEEAGLIIDKKKHGTEEGYYDRFRDRIIFPIFDLQGRVIAFGGRILPESSTASPAKYLNSPESLLYKKGENLYGLSLAKESIRLKKQVVLVEGNFDVLSLHSHGITNAVAPMGTALTEWQARLLKRLIGEEGHVILMLDGDPAGQKATFKDIALFMSETGQENSFIQTQGNQIRVVRLPVGEDPDTLVKANPQQMKSLLQKARPAIDYLIEESLSHVEDDSVATKANVLRKTIPLLRIVKNRASLDMYISKLATSLNLPTGLILKQLRETDSAIIERQVGTKSPKSNLPVRKFDSVTQNLLALCGDHPQLIGEITEELISCLEEPAVRELLHEAKDRALQGELVRATTLIEISPPEWRDLVAAAVFAATFSTLEDPRRALSSIGSTVRVRQIRQEKAELHLRLEQACKDQNAEQIQKLTLRMQELNDLSQSTNISQ